MEMQDLYIQLSRPDHFSSDFGTKLHQILSVENNCELIHRANKKHQSIIPDNIASNVSLICEINGNISKVFSIYSNLSLNFANMVSQCRCKRRTTKMNNNNNNNNNNSRVESSENNCELIHRANKKHQSIIPDNIASNVSQICEINGNISKVVSIYSNLSLNFANMVSRCRCKRRRTKMNNNNNRCVESSQVFDGQI
ncbi:hypothetical protein Dsin_004110 [Dipteronia sinensis]|uniref:Protein EARLY FLOWERING 4 domain-containing protein n=1 Tax=Dipteronia sinensis TaxID=43782 RepID=A0AAE0BA75_9ROSI|nr:hypothetical protein Dsin_004110 [Dipteronia sinensis]